ncbi:MAG TPA: AtzG-like protein [Ramlibacter sp.]|nr:AtzG-like protein [Ramlibacter sp.]
MNDDDILAYVKAAARAVNMPLDDAAALRVAGHLARTGGMARMLDGADLAPEQELVEIYKPAPFPVDHE